jgi:hypothetical protein
MIAPKPMNAENVSDADQREKRHGMTSLFNS